MIHKLFFLLYSIYLICIIPSITIAQELEIFIPEKTINMINKQETDNILARCLATSLEEYCAGISFESKDVVFEKNGISEISLETFIIDLNDDDMNKNPKIKVKSDNVLTKRSETIDVKSTGMEIKFDFNSYKLRIDQLEKISILATALSDKINVGKKYAIIGHTDGKGSYRYNCNLSKKRANTLTTKLILTGIEAELIPIGAGEALLKDPLIPHHKKNRRVSFLSLDKDAKTTINAFRSLCD